jgi:hypothetical protein
MLLNNRGVGMFKYLTTFFCACCAFTVTALHADVIVSGPLDHDYEVAKGAKIEGAITLINTEDKEADVKLYQVDIRDCAEKTICGLPGSAPRSNALWLDLVDPDFITLKPKEKRKIRYQINVPSDQEIHGTYWSVIMVEPVEAFMEEKSKGITIRSIVRYGIQIITSIGDEKKWDINVVGKKVNAESMNRSFKLDVENKGSRAFKAPVFFQMFTKEGDNILKKKTLPRRIFPGSTIEYSFDIPKAFVSGEYQVLIFFENDDDFLGVEYDITLPELPEEKAKVIKGEWHEVR